MATIPSAPRGQLFIWTDVDPAHDPDFNRWYDREHMQERIGIAGFERARRFRAAAACPRPYLALYDTENLQVFRSTEYRQAFARQTEWSRRNFARMRDTQRRVGELTVDAGEGEGGALALFVLADLSMPPAQLEPHFRRTVEREHVVRASLLDTDLALSSPLSADAPPARADRVAMVEATDVDAAFDAAQRLARQLSVDAADGGVYVFRTLWRLGA
ncbi:MAG: hypothetical protein IH627_01510 [Rubrivivax sp.]|nr:hypothetical protein [Rubrivivax sp.]